MSNMNVSTSFADRKTDVPSRGADLDKTKRWHYVVESLAARDTTLTKPNGVSVERRSLLIAAYNSIGLAIDAIPTPFFSYALISKPKC